MTKKDIYIRVLLEREIFSILIEAYFNLKKRWDEEQDFDFDKELRELAVFFSEIRKVINFKYLIVLK